MKEYTATPLSQVECDLGEGPFYDHSKGLLHFIDINNQLLNTLNISKSDNEPVESFKLSAKPGCAVNRKRGGILVALPGKIACIDGIEGIDSNEDNVGNEETILVEVEGEPTTNRMNDGKCDPAGRFWFGSMALNETDPTANLWMLDQNLKLHHKLGGVTISNGIAWNAARDRMYYIDTPTNTVALFDYDDATGEIQNRRVAFKNVWGGHFDGMTIDSQDNLYVALWAGAAVLKVSVEGDLLAKINLPEVTNVTSCTFAGADLQHLYITSAKDKEAAVQKRNAGALFKVSLPDARGVEPVAFEG